MSAASREERFFSGLPELPADVVTFAKHYLAISGDSLMPRIETLFDTPPFALMPRVVIADMLSDRDYRIRYFGTGMVDLVGKDYTGITASQSRAAGIEIHLGIRGWEAFQHPCGYLSKRTIFRRNRPPALEAVFDHMTLALPVAVKSGTACVLNYNSMPYMARDQHALDREANRYKVEPICWLDIGAGVPAVPLAQ